MDSGKVFLVPVRIVLLTHLLHFLWNDDGGSHTQQSTCPNCRILLLLTIQPLLRVFDCQASEFFHPSLEQFAHLLVVLNLLIVGGGLVNFAAVVVLQMAEEFHLSLPPPDHVTTNFEYCFL
jgi:hypothetical protein